MAWNPNWNNGKKKLLKVALNELREAVSQRFDYTASSISADIFQIARGRLIPASWFTAFQSAIDTLIPYYVDYADSSGDWTGETVDTDVAPLLDEANVLTKIGASRLSPPTDPQFAPEWMDQQKDILNVLRWVRQAGQTGVNQQRTAWSNLQADFNTAWSVANALWVAGSWVGGGSGLGATSTLTDEDGPVTATVATYRYQAKYNNVGVVEVDVQEYNKGTIALPTGDIFTDTITLEDTSGVAWVAGQFIISGTGTVSASTDGNLTLYEPTRAARPAADPPALKNNINGFISAFLSAGNSVKVIKPDFTQKGW